MQGIVVPDLTPKKGSKSVSSSVGDGDADSFRSEKKRPDLFVSEEDDAKVHATAADPIFRLGWSASP